jgi:putative ABC transport system permease protein
MLISYFKISLRNIKKQKNYVFINVTGLAVGIACCTLIFTFLNHELSYDSFHENQDSLFRLIRTTKNPESVAESIAIHPLPLGPALQEEFPEISDVVRLITSNAIVSHEGKSFNERLLFADACFFDVFTFPLMKGNSGTALNSPDSIILSVEKARKYFGESDPLGKNITVDISGESHDLIVTGVSSQTPINSSIQFDFVLRYEKYPDYSQVMTNWRSSRTRTYVQLSKYAQASAVESKFPFFVAKYLGEIIKRAQSAGYLAKGEEAWQLHLEPIRSIHLNPYVKWGFGLPGNPANIIILTGLAFLVLLVACINFVTLAVGRSFNRIKEVGIRKVFGAVRKQLILQFLGESFLLILFALFIGVMLAEFSLPLFNSLVNRNLTIDYVSNPIALVFIIGMLILMGIFAGGYPALYFSGFHPVRALSERMMIHGKSLLSKILVILQYSLSIFLMVSTLIMWNQMRYMNKKHLGYDKDQVLSIWSYSVGQEGEGERILEIFRNELSGRDEILGISGTSDSFTQGWSVEGWEHDGVQKTAFVYRIDPEYLDTLGIELLRGRNFSEKFRTDAYDSLIINEALVKELGWTSGLEERLLGFESLEGMRNPKIIGVVKDFHFESLHRKIEPVILHINPSWPINSIMVRIRTTDKAAVLQLLKETWEKATFQKPFDYHFMSEDVNNQYNEDRRWSRIVSFSSILAIIISCFGLFGLASLRVTQRTKEIGIRKVVGASVVKIVQLINFEFLKLVALANIIAWPMAYFAMNRWIKNFAYRTSVEIWIFLLAAALALIIALITVSIQSVKAALVNPVDTLRFE